MTAPGSNHQSEEWVERLVPVDASLLLTMAPSDFDSAVHEFAQSNPSKDPQMATPLTPLRTYMESRAYATVPISIKPGSGPNMVHQIYHGGPMEPPDLLCSATARLLDLQTLLEMPLAILGIRMQRKQSVSQTEQGALQRVYLWPDRAKVAAIEVIRIPREPAEGSTVVATEPMASTQLTPADFARTVWDFVQPEQNMHVIIHIQTVPGKPPPFIPSTLPSLIETDRPRGQKRMASITYSPPPRDSAFRNSVEPRVCVITRNSGVLQAAHIISRSLRYQLVKDVMMLLFGMDSPPATATAKPALFGHRPNRAIHDKEDDPRNGILLSPSLHTVYESRRTIWILRQRCYLIGTPLCCEEFSAFDPPDPSFNKVRKIYNEAEDLALWKEQLSHEEQVVPLQCAKLSPTQECLLHLSALLSFFWLFMKKREAMQGILGKLENETNDGLSSDSDDQPGPSKKQKMSQPDGIQAQHEGAGPTASGGTDGAPNTLTSANSDDENEDGSDSDLDPDSSCEEESDWDEDEHRRRELLHSDTLALLLMKHTLTSGVGQLYD